MKSETKNLNSLQQMKNKGRSKPKEVLMTEFMDEKDDFGLS